MEILNKIDISKLPYEPRAIFEALGADGYLVGGSVRDIILGLKPKDYDFATSLHPNKVINRFELCGYKVIPTGIKYGTVTVMINKEPIEITTFRKDVEYIDGRRPDVVEFADTIEEDLSRRDFTMNAICVDCYGNIIDPFGGQSDLRARILRTVGDADDRMSEDRLRVLRAFRFCAKYDLRMHKDVASAISYYSRFKGEDVIIDITNLSIERVRDEFNKILMTDSPRNTLLKMNKMGILQQFLPELEELKFDQRNPHHFSSVYNHSMNLLINCHKNLELRLACLFHDLGKAETFTIDENGTGHFYEHNKASAISAREIMTRMKYSNDEIDRVCDLVYHHMIRYDKVGKKQARRFLNKVGVDLYEDLIDLMICDRMASRYEISELEDIFRLKFLCEQVLEDGQAIDLSNLKVNGNDLISIGFIQGKIIGQVLNELKEIVLDNPEKNSRDNLLKESKLILKRIGANNE